MAHSNGLISFLRHYGPIPASDNMYDELIQSEIERHAIDPPVHIKPARLDQVKSNFESANPRNVILTGTAGDGKTYHCRRVWEELGGDPEEWKAGEKTARLRLPAAGRTMVIVKDLSELTQVEKSETIANLARAVTGETRNEVYLVAANDGQLLASWRDWSDTQGREAHSVFRKVESMLVEERSVDDALLLDLYNLSCLDASAHFKEIVEQIAEHPQWSQCQGCELLNADGTSNCPIRINRERLRGGADGSMFRTRLCELMKLARANRMHFPIRDLLLLGVNILLGDRQSSRILLTCHTAKIRAKKQDHRLTNPYVNAFGMNLPERKRQQYQVFTTLEGFGIGRQTDNRFDNLLIYGKYEESDHYKKFVAGDNHYGESAYKQYLLDYLEGERKDMDEFLRALGRQRQRLFFSLPYDSSFDPWQLTVYQESGLFLEFVSGLMDGGEVSQTAELLVKGLNRTFCGMMIEDGTQLYLARSGGDGRGRIASLLNYELHTKPQRRVPYLHFTLAADQSTPCLRVTDPDGSETGAVDSLNLQLTHFEYLVRVAKGSLPASFSRQCHEDFLDFKLRLISRLDGIFDEDASTGEINLQALTVDESGRPRTDKIRIGVGQ